LKILHIVAGDLNGGAARGAYWLHLGLKDLGVHSVIFTNSESTLGDSSVVTITKSKKDKLGNIVRAQLDSLLTYLYPKRTRVIFSSGWFGYDFTKTTEYQDADIIHLHWINGGFVNIKHLSKINKPIIWTLRDMWPLTGGCHYTMGCEKYKTGCGKCEQLNSKFSYDFSRVILNRKKKFLKKNIKIVGISHWLSGEAKKSELFRSFDIRTISNNINTKDFSPVDRAVAKNILGIKTSKNIILVGSTSLNDFYKGFSKYIEAINILEKDKWFLCFLGEIDEKVVDNLGFEYISFGYLHDHISLRLAYSCANVFVVPSLMDAFGKTIAEAMSCATPVVCFDATGPKDIISHKVDGYKAEPFEAMDLAKGIEWVVNHAKYDALCLTAREKVLNEFDSSVVAKQYVELYDNVLDNKGVRVKLNP